MSPAIATMTTATWWAHAQGYGYKDIAKITGLSIAAVSMRLTRALRKLRKLYNQK